MTVTSHVARHGEAPTLFVNGKPLPGLAYITYFEERNHYRDFAEAGYRLFTFATFFGDQTINETTYFHPLSPGIFSVREQEDYSSFDQSVADILAACPEAMIFPRVNMSPPAWWEDENPDECNDAGCRQHPERRRLSFASLIFRQQAAEWLHRLIAHVESQPWRDSICGYQIACGNTEEWFAFDQAGSVGPAARRRFQEEGGNPDDLPAFRRFLSRQVADTIADLAAVVKRETGRRLAVGSFYGYTLETPWWQSGHHALMRLLDCPDLDFLCSPISYMNTRAPGLDWPAMTVLDSVKLHGKAYFAELDTRTHLTRFADECRPNSIEPNTYHYPLWQGPQTPDLSRWVLRQNIARQLTHGYNSWWFDMWGGWFDSPELMQEMRDLLLLAQQHLDDRRRSSRSQVAVILDENAYAELTPDTQPLAMAICYHGRTPLGLAGAPYDIYDVSDFETIQGRYRAFVFLAPAHTPALDQALERCRQWQLPTLCFDATTHTSLNTDTLRDFYRRAGVHLWTDTDDVIYASDTLLAIHAHTAGTKRITLPEPRAIRPLLPAAADLPVSDTLTLTLQTGETRILRLM